MTRSVVQPGLMESSYHCLCTGVVHLSFKKTWRVKAEGSPAHSSLCPQAVSVVKIEPSLRGLEFASHILALVLGVAAPTGLGVRAKCPQPSAS